MEVRANYVWVGLFTIVFFVGVALLFFWIGRFDAADGGRRVDILFPGAVTGLQPGSDVLFNGIRVGQVEDLSVDANRPAWVRAAVRVKRGTPLRADTTAHLEQQGLTGLARVQILGGSSSEPLIARSTGGFPLIVAQEARSGDVMQAAKRIAARAGKLLGKFEGIAQEEGLLDSARSTLDGISDFLEKNEETIAKAIIHIESFFSVLAKNSATVDDILSRMDDFTARLSVMSDEVEEIIAQIKDVSRDGSAFIDEARATVKEIRVLTAKIDEYANVFESDMNSLMGGGLEELRAFAVDGQNTFGAIRSTVQDFERSPQRFLFGQSQIPEYQ